MVSSPLHRLDCCVMSDGGGALIVARPEIACSLKRPVVMVRGTGEAPKHGMGGRIDLTWSAAAWSGPRAFEEADGVRLTPTAQMELDTVFANEKPCAPEDDMAMAVRCLSQLKRLWRLYWAQR